MDVLEDSKRRGSKLHITYVDFCKAFDLVGHQALFETLEFYNLGHKFVDLIHALYTGCNSDIFLNNSVSESFPIERGV